MSRCKACDNELSENEIIWRPKVEQWEDLCRKCLAIVFSNDDLVAPDYLLIEDVGETDDERDDY